MKNLTPFVPGARFSVFVTIVSWISGVNDDGEDLPVGSCFCGMEYEVVDDFSCAHDDVDDVEGVVGSSYGEMIRSWTRESSDGG